MSALDTVQIRADEEFPHLARAPVVEVVIDLRARASEQLEEESCRSRLEPRMEGYRFLDSEREYLTETKMSGGKSSCQRVQDPDWRGLRIESLDHKQIAQFNRDGFVFSRLGPYEDWSQLQGEAFRLWEIFRALAKPVEFQRIGLRFINRIHLAATDPRFKDYIRPILEPPRDFNLPVHGFMHHDTLAVPGHPYAINVIRTIQPSVSSPDGRMAIILDIDVFSNQSFEVDGEKLGRRLGEMRWLKNKVFFGSITETVLEGFK